MKKLFNKRIFALMLSVMVVFSSSFMVMGAEEGTGEGEEAAQEAEAGEGEGQEGEDGEEAQGEEAAPEGEEATPEGEGSSLTMSDLQADNGRFIAATFPDDLMPEGFHKSGCTYKDQRIEIAYMDSDAAGDVVLAYLADEDGSNGDFYLCDIITAQMSDFVQIKNGAQGYIIVLNPGDNVVAPAGFTRAELKYGDKTVTAWMLPQEESVSLLDDPFTVNVYAGEINRIAMGGVDGLLSGSKEEEPEEADEGEAKEEEKQEEKAEDVKDASGEGEAAATASEAVSQEEDGSRLVSAPSSDFFMVYAIDNTGTVGFYLYDKVQKTYQRYVALSSADSEGAASYKKSAQIRLYIIAGLAFVVIILLFVLVNMMISRRDEDEDEYESEEPEDFYERQRRKREARDAQRHESQDRPARRRSRALEPMNEDYADREGYEEQEYTSDVYAGDEYAGAGYDTASLDTASLDPGTVDNYEGFPAQDYVPESVQEPYAMEENIAEPMQEAAPMAGEQPDNRVRRRSRKSTPKKLHDRSEMRDLIGMDEEEDYRGNMGGETKVIPSVQSAGKAAMDSQPEVRRMPPSQSGPSRKPSRTVASQSQPQAQGVGAKSAPRRNPAQSAPARAPQGNRAPRRGANGNPQGAVGNRPVRNNPQVNPVPRKKVDVDDDLDFEFLDV
ncbi:MAG: hypothetical protein IJM23_01190 [Lachnospiraceae bacterium]|nr:hypothetical protein [Lachnospiraceae bacterium]